MYKGYTSAFVFKNKPCNECLNFPSCLLHFNMTLFCKIDLSYLCMEFVSEMMMIIMVLLLS